MDQTLNALTLLTQILVQANVAVPIVIGVIGGIAAMFKGLTGNGPSATELADAIESQLDENDAAGRAELVRLRALDG